MPKAAHGSINLKGFTSSTQAILDAVTELYDRIVNRDLLVRRMYVVANHVMEESGVTPNPPEQLDLFTDYAALERERQAERTALEREKRRQRAMLEIKKKFGKNAILKGMNLEEGATARDRNRQIGGHKA